jgi:hypothetical protein
MTPVPPLVRSQIRSLIQVSIRTFVRAMAAWTLAGAVLAGAAYATLGDAPGFHRAIAVVAALAESGVLGFFLATKRAIAMTTVHTLGTFQLGRLATRTVFQRLLGIVEGGQFGERGGRIARGLERIPLATADALLSNAIGSMVGDANGEGALRRKLNFQLVDMIHRYTLARFREDDAKFGGVNLAAVQAELEPTIDARLIGKLRAGVRIATWFSALALLAVVALQTWGLRVWAAGN